MNRAGISGRRHIGSVVGAAACWAAAAIVTAVCLFIIGFLAWRGWSSVDWTFLSTDPVPSLVENQGGGVRVPIVGTMILTLLSVAFVFPVAVGAAIYLAEYMDENSWLTRIVRVGLEVLASVPSVVFGVFGLAMFSLPVFTFLSSSGAEGSTAAFGRSFIVAAIVMGIHILPFVIKVSEEAIRSVPVSMRQGALALGVSKWRTISKVVLPAARSGIATAVVLGMGLAAGDTAIVWLTLGGTISMAVDDWWKVQQWLPVLRGTGSTLTTFIYFNSPAGEGNSEALAYGAALVLIVLVLALNLGAIVLGRRKHQDRA
ncbi:MAG: phosphate ABC transporter permease PstA [Coriobacteriia bacterium]|nr:phosphate ABC transporter permease PstA [Coriobacteriia bacterium]